MLVKCPVCKGTGEREATDEQTGNKYPTKCDVCDGAGKVDKGATYTGKRKVVNLRRG